MKIKPAVAVKPLTATEQLLEKRETFIVDRDALLAKLLELNTSIESIDSVITMFDPNHVPMDIRRAQNTPMLTLTAQPVLEEVVAQAAKSAPKTKPAAEPKVAAKSSKETPATSRKGGRGAKADVIAPPPSAAARPAKPTSALSEAISDKAKKKTKPPGQSNKKLEAAREQVREYFGDIDKLKTLEDIVSSSTDGVPFRVICEQFAERHPIDVSKAEVKKVFSDRLSALLHSLSQQKIVQRGERQGDDGKQENVWVNTRASRDGAGAETAAAL
jgi:hypothetical protein